MSDPERIKELERLIMAMGDKLLTLAEHLGRLAERKEARGVNRLLMEAVQEPTALMDHGS